MNISFLQQLKQNLETRDDILSLILLDSHPEQADQNFFVITRPQNQEVYRNNLDWIPNHQEISFYFQDTTHSTKVFFDDGHTLDFSVFDKSELFLAQVSLYEILFDKAGISVDMEQISQMTTLRAQTLQAPLEILWGRFLFCQVTAIQRAEQGESLSAHHLLKHQSIDILLRIILDLKQELNTDLVDSLDISRHWDKISPSWNSLFDDILTLEPAAFISALWNHISNELFPLLPEVCLNQAGWFTDKFTAKE